MDGKPETPAPPRVLTALWTPGSRPQHTGGRGRATLEGAAPPAGVRSSRQAPQTLPQALLSRAGSSGWRRCLRGEPGQGRPPGAQALRPCLCPHPGGTCSQLPSVQHPPDGCHIAPMIRHVPLLGQRPSFQAGIHPRTDPGHTGHSWLPDITPFLSKPVPSCKLPSLRSSWGLTSNQPSP